MTPDGLRIETGNEGATAPRSGNWGTIHEDGGDMRARPEHHPEAGAAVRQVHQRVIPPDQGHAAGDEGVRPEGPETAGLALNQTGSDLARLMPMFIAVDGAGIIRAAGPTIQLVCGARTVIGKPFTQVFHAIRGRELTVGGPAGLLGAPLHLAVTGEQRTSLRAMAIPAWLSETRGGIAVHLGAGGGEAVLLDRHDDSRPNGSGGDDVLGPPLGAVPGTGAAGAGAVGPGDQHRGGRACDQEGAAGQGVLVNFSFGIDLAEAVRRHALTGADFASTDLAMELLYLQEAKTAVMTELQALNGRLEDARRTAESQALTDPLTGLANRRALEVQLAAAITQLQAGGGNFALAHLDLDHFKQVNDSLGHAAGDQVLIRVSEILRTEIRRSDIAARVGGDEFVLLLRGFDDPARLADLGQRLIARIEEPVPIGDDCARVSASIGVIIADSDMHGDADQLLSQADAALYASKHAGRAQCTIFGAGMG